MSQNQAVGHVHEEEPIEGITGLRPGAKLLRGQYEILRYLSHGGFGITYLARDSLDRDVVIKECYPGALCRRDGDLVTAADPAHQQDLRSIIELFILEARNHARLVHPNIVEVHQVFEDNQTAYIAMDLIRGCDLLDYVQDPANKADADFIVQVTEKMLSAVAFIHDSGMLHRDISPDNILIDENGEPILIDFGAAREQAANKSAALLQLRVIKDGYSPHEFYVRGSEQGPSSDLYVLAATLYHTISGERPVDGQSRLNAFNNSLPDPYTPLAGHFDGYPEGFLEAIDKAMEVHATDRLQSALDWLRMFRGPGVVFETFGYRPVSVIVAVDRQDEEELSEAEKQRIRAETDNAEAVVTALLAGNPDIVVKAEEKAAQPAPELSVKDEAQPAVDTIVQSSSGGSGKMLTGVAALVLIAAAGGWFVYSGGEFGGAGTQTDTQQIATPADAPEQEPAPITAEAPAPAAQEEAPEIAAAPTEAPAEPNTTDGREPVEQSAQIQPEPAGDVTETAEKPLNDTSGSDTPPTLAEPVDLRENQVAFAHWDVDLPFSTSIRRTSTANAIAITGVDAGTDLSMIGDWIERGAVIFTINGEPVRDGATFATQILDDLKVDDDGYIRAAVRYRPRGQTRVENGLIAVPALRVFGTETGLELAARSSGADGWQTEVTRVGADGGTLQTGDILLREDITGTTITGPESLDETLAALVSEGAPQAQLVVLRNGAETKALMPLAAK